MIEYRAASFATHNHEAKGDEWAAHTSGDRIQRLFDDKDFCSATDPRGTSPTWWRCQAGSDVTTHDAEAARSLLATSRQTTNLLRPGAE
jgi:hypothetical protein